MENKFYFSVFVTDEQEKYANELVEYSLANHPIPNIWDKYKKTKTKALRITGSLGEIIFADLYQLERPKRSFGAIDGQDYGKDFELILKNKEIKFDIKTMLRKSNIFYKNYVLNIPARNIKRNDSITDYYYCISLHKSNNQTIASLIGYIKKQDILSNKIGILYKKSAKRVRKDNSSFSFFEDTYEIFFENIKSPLLTDKIKKLDGFKIHYLK